jgi:hypothetical protein
MVPRTSRHAKPLPILPWHLPMRLQILQRDFVVPATARAALVPAPALTGPIRAALAAGMLRSAS